MLSAKWVVGGFACVFTCNFAIYDLVFKLKSGLSVARTRYFVLRNGV